MSADNVIYIQKRRDYRFWVWMGFISDDLAPAPEKSDAKFYKEADAWNYAEEIVSSELVEYGIVFLSPETPQPPVLARAPGGCELAERRSKV
jgi:hypothetical protein